MNTLENLFGSQSPEERSENAAFILMFRFLSQVEKYMEEEHITKKELAAKIGTSASFVTQLFRGTKIANLTILAKIESALGVEFKIHMCKRHKMDAGCYDFNYQTQIGSSGSLGNYFTAHLQNLGDTKYSCTA